MAKQVTEAVESDTEATTAEFEALQAMADMDHAVSISTCHHEVTLIILCRL